MHCRDGRMSRMSQAELDSTKELTANANTINIGTCRYDGSDAPSGPFNLGTSCPIDSFDCQSGYSSGTTHAPAPFVCSLQSGEPTWIGGPTCVSTATPSQPVYIEQYATSNDGDPQFSSPTDPREGSGIQGVPMPVDGAASTSTVYRIYIELLGNPESDDNYDVDLQGIGSTYGHPMLFPPCNRYFPDQVYGSAIIDPASQFTGPPGDQSYDINKVVFNSYLTLGIDIHSWRQSTESNWHTPIAYAYPVDTGYVEFDSQLNQWGRLSLERTPQNEDESSLVFTLMPPSGDINDRRQFPPGNRFGSFVATPPRFASVASSDFSPYPNPQNPIFKTTGEGSPTQVDFNQEILNGGCSLDDDCTGQGQLGSLRRPKRLVLIAQLNVNDNADSEDRRFEFVASGQSAQNANIEGHPRMTEYIQQYQPSLDNPWQRPYAGILPPPT